MLYQSPGLKTAPALSISGNFFPKRAWGPPIGHGTSGKEICVSKLLGGRADLLLDQFHLLRAHTSLILKKSDCLTVTENTVYKKIQPLPDGPEI